MKRNYSDVIGNVNSLVLGENYQSDEDEEGYISIGIKKERERSFLIKLKVHDLNECFYFIVPLSFNRESLIKYLTASPDDRQIIIDDYIRNFPNGFIRHIKYMLKPLPETAVPGDRRITISLNDWDELTARDVASFSYRLYEDNRPHYYEALHTYISGSNNYGEYLFEDNETVKFILRVKTDSYADSFNLNNNRIILKDLGQPPVQHPNLEGALPSDFKVEDYYDRFLDDNDEEEEEEEEEQEEEEEEEDQEGKDVIVKDINNNEVTFNTNTQEYKDLMEEITEYNDNDIIQLDDEDKTRIPVKKLRKIIRPTLIDPDKKENFNSHTFVDKYGYTVKAHNSDKHADKYEKRELKRVGVTSLLDMAPIDDSYFGDEVDFTNEYGESDFLGMDSNRDTDLKHIPNNHQSEFVKKYRLVKLVIPIDNRLIYLLMPEWMTWEDLFILATSTIDFASDYEKKLRKKHPGELFIIPKYIKTIRHIPMDYYKSLKRFIMYYDTEAWGDLTHKHVKYLKSTYYLLYDLLYLPKELSVLTRRSIIEFAAYISKHYNLLTGLFEFKKIK